MTATTWRFVFEGTASDGLPWAVGCDVAAESGDLEGAFIAARGQAFRKLTQGKAVYGSPGVGGCKGPYKINRVSMEVQS